ncbi:MAG: AAA family ATPase [Acidimicrobiales bacterium]
MRPVRLELEGFGPYRDNTLVDFAGADLFALTGPTGSGKSSIVDAICFALYGSIPRYDDRRLVAPAISQGMAEALVRLDLTIDGEAYTAVRVLKRTKTGATTKEARLEKDGVVLAGNERELTAEVERLLGLTYEHFTKCVVLPQGEFARFLHDKPDRRQELLVELLDLGVYGRMATLAHQLARDAERDATAAGERIAALADASDEARDAARQRVEALAAVRRALEAELPALAELGISIESARAEAATARREAEALAAVAVPADLLGHTAAVGAANEALLLAEHAFDVAGENSVTAEKSLTALGSRSELETAKRAREERAKRDALRIKGRAELNFAEAELQRARAAEEPELASFQAAEIALERARTAHAGHALREHLVAGEPCPVCEQVVATMPSSALPADLDAAVRTHDRARTCAQAAAKEKREAELEHTRVADRLELVHLAIAELDGTLADRPSLADVVEQLGRVAAAEDALEAARAEERSANTARTVAAAAVRESQEAEAGARRQFHETQSTLAALGAPVPGGADLVADWRALEAWAVQGAPARREMAKLADTRADALGDQRDQRTTELLERCRGVGVKASGAGGELRDAVVGAHRSAEHEVTRIDESIGEGKRLRTVQEQAKAKSDVAKSLHGHLGSRGFERWLLDEALAELVVTATESLLELSGGQYSLTLDDRGFAVVDHRNADQVRSARTLSGGETFLASLALALALAEQLTLMAGRSGARLESLFLDEGFGTLDPDTLDTVASAIEALGARGRMVGLITHVPELAERVPVRFVVTKHGNAAGIERHDQ